MKKITQIFALTAAITFGLNHPLEAEPSLDAIFAKPPPESRPSVYWYWMNGNISREGIAADLEGFAKVGVGGVYLMDIGIHPKGGVVQFSPEWFELVNFAVTEADKHGIKVSFHSPGWSASGGPWITPELGMQEVTWSEVIVQKSGQQIIALPEPPNRLGFYRDAAVIAFPTPKGDEPLPQASFADTKGKPLAIGMSLNQEAKTEASFPLVFDILFQEPVEVRSVFARTARATGSYQATLEAWDDVAGNFRPVVQFRSFLSGPFSAQVGSGSFEPVRASKFRLAFKVRKGERVLIEDLQLSGGYRLVDWTSKAGFATSRVVDKSKATSPQADDIIAMDQIVDLTGKLSDDGKLAWNVPAGRWTILRIGHTPTGIHIHPPSVGGKGLESDKLSREANDFHYDQFMKPLLNKFGPDLSKKVLEAYHVDSYEAGWQNWTTKFPQDFQQRRGYSLVNYLPALTGRIVGDVETTEKFLWDFRRTIGDLFADNHYGQLAKRSHEDGLLFSNEPYGGPFEFLQVGGRSDLPMIEFWTPTKPEGQKLSLHGVLAGRTNDRKVIGAEAFTSGPGDERWAAHPYSLKALGDYIYCSGVNRFVVHVSAHQPLIGEQFKPGFTCGGNGIHFDRNNTWWPEGAKAWVDYLKRCQAMLQAGQHVADVLYFQGNDSPDNVGPFDPILPEGYERDVCNAEVLERLRMENGRLVLPSGKSYRYLVLPKHGRVTMRSLEKIAALAKEGARVVGNLPLGSPSLSDAAKSPQYQQLVQEIAARIESKKTFEEIFAADGLPADFACEDGAKLRLHWIHRKVDDMDLYFVSNALRQAGVVECTFRVSGKTPELWDPNTGKITPCATYSTTESTVKIPLRFDESGSVFVVFKPGPSGLHALDVQANGESLAGTEKQLRVLKAVYGDGAKRSVDVTQKVAASIKNGQLKLGSFSRLSGDPAPGALKTLRVDYELGGKSLTATAKDGEWLHLPPLEGKLPDFELCSKGKGLELLSSVNGSYQIHLSDGRSEVVEFASVPAPQNISGPWEVQFPPNWGAPENVSFEKLVSWPDHTDPGVRHFSGTATYRKRFESKLKGTGRVYLDLGQVEIIAQVWLNGKALRTLWKPPFRCDVTDALKNGTNELEVRVTNLWANRLIGDEQLPDDSNAKGDWTSGGIRSWPDWVLNKKERPDPRRFTFATWKHWGKDDSLLPSGLIGPVVLQSMASVDIK
jgi:hypothetical protein